MVWKMYKDAVKNIKRLCKVEFTRIFKYQDYFMKKYKFWFLFFISILFLIIIYYNFFKSIKSIIVVDTKLVNTSCYNKTDKYIKLQADQNLKTTERTIFFLETSCIGGLNSRQACSVESAATVNPDWDIIILLTSPLDISYENAKTYRYLSTLKNVKFARLNISEFTKNTNIESLYTRNIFTQSNYPIVHQSDVLRILILNKYGGVYLDLDVIVMRSFNTLPDNFVTKESEDHLASGVLRFSKDGIGKVFSDYALQELQFFFNPKSWAANGPLMIGRVMDEICDDEIPSTQRNATYCQGMDVLGPENFFPIQYNTWRKYFQDHEIEETEAYAHHFWNALSRDTKIETNSLFARLARKYCPNVYNLYGDEFGS